MIRAGVLFEPGRPIPRRRHEVPSWVLAALSPLFRYSDWRDAWVLRLIGERYGPVLLRPETDDAYESPPSRLAQRMSPAGLSMPDRASRVLPLGGSALLMMLAAAVILAAAALGFTTARSGNGGGASPKLTRHASAGLLALSAPADWRQTSPVAVQLGLQDEIALGPSRPRGEMLVIGRTVTADPQLLPQTLLASLPSAPVPATVKLGGMTFYRYLNLSPSGERTSESVYAMSTTVGTVLGLCIAPMESISFTSSCERSLATLKLASGKALQPGPIPDYESALALAIKRLDDVRTKVGSQLRTAPSAKAQAKAAYALAAAHAQAAAALSHLNAGPANAANAAVVAALVQSDAAYRSLGRAAALQDPTRYRDARASLQRATSALTAAYSRLEAFGYSVS